MQFLSFYKSNLCSHMSFRALFIPPSPKYFTLYMRMQLIFLSDEQIPLISLAHS